MNVRNKKEDEKASSVSTPADYRPHANHKASVAQEIVDSALRLTRTEANRGNVETQFNLGVKYYKGIEAI